MLRRRLCAGGRREATPRTHTVIVDAAAQTDEAGLFRPEKLSGPNSNYKMFLPYFVVSTVPGPTVSRATPFPYQSRKEQRAGGGYCKEKKSKKAVGVFCRSKRTTMLKVVGTKPVTTKSRIAAFSIRT